MPSQGIERPRYKQRATPLSARALGIAVSFRSPNEISGVDRDSDKKRGREVGRTMHGANKAAERLKAVSLLFPGETGGWKFSKNPQKQVASLSLCLTLTHDHESSPLERWNQVIPGSKINLQ